jgi:hypothetical protein
MLGRYVRPFGAVNVLPTVRSVILTRGRSGTSCRLRVERTRRPDRSATMSGSISLSLPSASVSSPSTRLRGVARTGRRRRHVLVVMCGPRISRDFAGVLDTDPDLRFTKLDTGWALEDRTTGEVYKSGPDDDGRPYDVAYLGRLRRPDGNGMLIVFTGIHPPGSLGVVHLLTSQLAELQRDARKGPFSVLVGVEYDEDTHEPVKVQTITPVHRHGN